MNNKKPILKIFGSIRFKLVLLYMALVFIVMIISGTFIYVNIRNLEAANVEREIESYVKLSKEQILLNGDNIELAVENIKEGSRGEDGSQKVLPLDGRSDLEFCILDEKGFVVLPKEIYNSHIDDTVVVSAAIGKEEYSPWERDAGKISDAVKVWMKYAAPILDENGEIIYIIYIAKDAEDILKNFNVIVGTLVISVVIAMFLAIIIGVLFSATITGPIYSLTKTAGEMAMGNLRQEIPVKSDDEIGILTNSFNEMAKSLDRTMEDISIEKSRIEIILNNMTDGVLAYDASNELVHANFSSLEMLGVEEIYKLEFKDIMHLMGIEVENATDFSKAVFKENITQINNKFISFNYNVYSSQQGTAEGVVIVLQDVTKHTKLDNMRKEFVANVSHEIRTPLTTIKTYSETLLDGAMDDKEIAMKFLGTINDEADRITLLTTDLLELSHFDNKQMKMAMEEVNLVSIINNSIFQNTILANNKNQSIVFEKTTREMFVLCDPERINQVLNNIISNAIKYSDEGKKITVSTDEKDNQYNIYIKDEGFGIPKEDLSRIFERFFRVDKARSRKMGGTGLGLSIAKEIMEAHNGKLQVFSTPNVGTTMVLTFQKLQ